MYRLFIHIVDSVFSMRDDGADYDRPETALTRGVEAAIDIAADEVRSGSTTSAVQVSVEEADATLLLRAVVTIAVAPLLAEEATA